MYFFAKILSIIKILNVTLQSETIKHFLGMKKTLTKQQIIEIGNKLADANIVDKYPPRSHSHNRYNLFPQSEAQYNWLKKDCGITSNLIVIHPAEEVLAICPELEGCVKATKNKKWCRIHISL